MQYFENTGSASNPQFAEAQTNPFGLLSNDLLAFPAFANLDGDGDIDLMVGGYYGTLKYFENTGSVSNPQFAEALSNPFGLVADSTFAFPSFNVSNFISEEKFIHEMNVFGNNLSSMFLCNPPY